MSALWLLEAKSFAEEDRTPAATSVRYWLKPGAYTVGRPGKADGHIAVDEDKSISRKHAELTVPPASEWGAGAALHVLLRDCSKYGTVVSRDGAFREGEVQAVGGDPAAVPPDTMLKFGFKSPFKLYHQDWVLYLSAAQRQGADAAELAELEQAAAATGLPLTGELPAHPGTRVLALGAAPLRIDGPLLLALLRGYPFVGANWLLEWQQHKVWCNSRPQEDGYPVQMQFTDVAGHLRALPPGAAAAAQRTAAEGQLLAGRTLLWLPPSRDASLQAAAALLGAANHNVAASGRAPAAAKAAGAVLVRGRESDAVPAAYSHLFWTTAELLIGGVLEGGVGRALREPAAATPPPGKKGGKGKGKGKALASRATAGKGKAAAAEEERADSGSETDVNKDASHLHPTERPLASDQPQQAAAPPPEVEQTSAVETLAPAGARRGRKAVAASPAAPGAGAAVDRKRRKAEAEPEEQEREAVGPTPAKKQRQAAPEEAPAERQPRAVMPAAEGWHSRAPQHADEASPEGRTAAPPVTASAAKPASRPRGSAATAAAGDHAADEAGGGMDEDGEEYEEEVVEEEEEHEEGGAARIVYTSLVVPTPAATAAGSSGSGGGGGPNFKAFRKGGGGAAAAAAAVARPVVAFAAQRYTEGGWVNADEFLKSEAERRRRAQQSDELFTANLKAKKAQPLPDQDDDSPPAKGRGRGGKKAAAAAGTSSILQFMAAAGGGRGRGRGAGRGKK